ncbi:AAA family ATPase [Pseudomonas chlororaphis]|nr:AAA family ATPase [Pseudomonas chlororaphis]QLL11110.1 AAA family ATPase [Pseudomonas chlororaphis subsp. aurantiaca]UCR85086.1 AAA family ATPase [Pseudomonas chlororaphis]
MKRILLLSGAIGVGKSTIAQDLKSKHGYTSISSSGYLRSQLELQGLQPTRLNLQQFGDQLDVDTDYSWIIDCVVVPVISGTPDTTHWLLDAVRKHRQVEHFKSRFPGLVKHVHLTVSEHTLEVRFNSRVQPHVDSSYQDAVCHPNEQAARSLIGLADLIVDTEHYSIEEITQRIAAFCQER